MVIVTTLTPYRAVCDAPTCLRAKLYLWHKGTLWPSFEWGRLRAVLLGAGLASGETKQGDKNAIRRHPLLNADRRHTIGR